MTTINGERGPSRTTEATRARRRNGAQRAAIVLGQRIRCLSDDDLIALARIVDDEIERRWPAPEEEDPSSW